MTGSEGDKGGSSVIDFSSPYYLHPSDSLKQPSVNEVLTNGNYYDWAREMTNFLFAKNKTDFVDGALKKPETSSSEYKSWMRCDAMIKGWLTTAMEKGICDSVKYANTSSEIWSDLKERFGKESAPRAYELKKKITATRQEGSSVSTYYTRLRQRLQCNLDPDLSNKTRLGTAYHMVAEDERQRSISLENQVVPEPAAFKAFQRRDNNFRSSKEKYMAKQEKENKQNEECTFCKKTDHKREGCFKLVGYPNWWHGKKDNKAKPKAAYVETGTSPIPGLNEGQYQEFVKFFSRSSNNVEAKPEANMAGNKDDVWVVDSGCTEYITHKSNLLENKKVTSNEAPVVIPNGHAIPVEGKGDFILPGGAKINGVLYIPNFKHNLLLGLRTRNLIGSSKCQGGLYLMDIFEKGRRAMMTTTDTWHKRLGHASRDKLFNVSFLKSNSSKLSNVFCDSRAKAKHVRNSFPKGFIKTNGCFELIHCDIWGGYRIPSYTRANFFLTIVDDYSSLDCNKDEPTKVHDDFKSTNFFLDNGEQNCFDGPPQNPSSTTTEDIGSEEENVAQHENDLFANNSPVWGPEIEEDHVISHEEPEPRSKRVRTQPAHLSEYVVNLPP
nr:putative Gag-pre-integrase domain, Gag-polypeptide of LTR copia-type [Tanacetum cinerariifolium]